MAKALAVGGIFIRSDDPEALSAWYKTHLGINGPPWMQEGGPAVLATFSRVSDYFETDRHMMINLRVDDLSALIDQLTKAGIAVETRSEWDSEIGRFARIHDPDGNPIELWESTA
jgi:predicted enzyme related to lactoylglutathione lyase